MFLDENKYTQESGFTQKWYSEEMDKVAKISDDKIAIGVKMAPNSSLNPGSLHRLDRRLMALASSRISQLS